jgi:hypothetical protein
MTATTVTGRGPGDSNKSLKPVLDNLIVQFNNLKLKLLNCKKLSKTARVDYKLTFKVKM